MKQSEFFIAKIKGQNKVVCIFFLLKLRIFIIWINHYYLTNFNGSYKSYYYYLNEDQYCFPHTHLLLSLRFSSISEISFILIFLDLDVKNLSFNIFKNLCEERFFQICQMHTLNDATAEKYVLYTVTGYQ